MPVTSWGSPRLTGCWAQPLGQDGAGAAAAATGSMAEAGVVLGHLCDLPCSPQFPLPSRYFLHSDHCIQAAKCQHDGNTMGVI